MGGLVAAGLLSLAIAAERLMSAVLVDRLTSYTSTRVIVAVVCIAVSSVLFALAAIQGDKPPRRPRGPRPRR